MQTFPWTTTLRVLVIALAAGVTPAAADTLGLPSSTGWSGYGSRVLVMNPATLIGAAEAPGSTEIDFATSRDDPPASVEAWALTAPYVLKGAISASGYDDQWRVGGYFRDELFVQSLTGAAVDVELQFQISGSWTVTGSDPYGLLRALWMSPAEGSSSFTPVAWGDAVNVGPASGATGTFDTTVSLWSNQYGHAIGSGTYLPTSITLYGDVVDVSLDWSHTAVLSGVNVYQGDRRLAPGEYTIYSTNGDAAFDEFATHMPAPVPEPAVLVLLGVAALAAGARLRQQGRGRMPR